MTQNKRYWKVAIPKPIDELYTYFSDEENDLTGCRVLVPFGRKNQLLAAVVVEETTANEKIKPKPITEIIDTVPAFDKNMLKFISWLSDYYIAPIGETFKVAIPAGISPKTLIKYTPNREIPENELEIIQQKNPVRWKLLSFLLSETKEFSLDYLEHLLEISNIQYHINYLLERNLISIHQTHKRITEKFAKAVRLNNRLLSDNNFLKETLDLLDKKASKQSEFVGFVLLHQRKNNKPVLLSDIGKVIANPNSVIKSLEKKELIEVVDVEIDRSKQRKNDEKLATKNEAILHLTDEQKHCVSEIEQAISANQFSPFLLFGVTGSGKTLVYIHAIQKAISEGKSALLLVPEISLTPQLIDRFDIVFPDMLAVFHSRLSDGERYDAWRSVLLGKTKIVIGARSALFAPLQNLGLIIVDEEHENSYKQASSMPYYQARDAALMRAKIENATIILGSATPSIESFHNAKLGKYKLLEIKHRADGAELPDIRLIDMISARKNGQVIENFSRTLIDSIKEKIAKKEGIILFQNKRGFASYLECYDCGNIPQCKHCSVSLTFHQATNELRCHYCGYTIRPSKVCEICGATKMNLVGFGTQRIEEKLLDILQSEGINCNTVGDISDSVSKEINIERLDLDSVRKKGSHRNILQKFANGETDILLGTQMVAKGLDFDRVTLVGVINADIQLLLPDFRAAERTFQLLSQVAGRAGRSGDKKGEVIIQTSQTSAYAITTMKNNDYEKFFEIELKHRYNAGFPPFVRYCVVEFSGKDENLTRKKATEFYSILQQLNRSINKKSITIYPPQAPPIEKINDRYRLQISLKQIKQFDRNSRVLHLLIKTAHKEFLKNFAISTVSIKIDIDSFAGY
jgi:primosomal protein N' (replication factor Y)